MAGFQNLQKGQTTREKAEIQVTYPGMAAENIPRGTVVAIIDGVATIATTANSAGEAIGVSVESVDNSGGAPGDLNIGVVLSNCLVAVQTRTALNPLDGVKVSTTAGDVDEFVAGVDDEDLKIGRYRGIEGAQFARAAGTPFRETLSAGIVPDQDAAIDDIVWIELLDR